MSSNMGDTALMLFTRMPTMGGWSAELRASDRHLEVEARMEAASGIYDARVGIGR